MTKGRFICVTLFLFFTILILSACASSSTPAPSQTKPTEPAVTAPTASPLPMDGKQLLEKRCVECHDLQRTESAKKSAAGWEKTVQRMIDKGASLTSDEKSILIEYLAKTYLQ